MQIFRQFSIAIIVLIAFKIVHDQSFGYDNNVEKTPMTSDKLFYIQSMTKPIVSVAFMTLYEQGLFSLTDPVSKFIPEFLLKSGICFLTRLDSLTGSDHMNMIKSFLRYFIQR